MGAGGDLVGQGVQPGGNLLGGKEQELLGDHARELWVAELCRISAHGYASKKKIHGLYLFPTASGRRDDRPRGERDKSLPDLAATEPTRRPSR